MTIFMNGQHREIATDMSLTSLITTCTAKPEHVIAELNGQIVDRSNWEKTFFKDNDKLELVTFVGGG